MGLQENKKGAIKIANIRTHPNEWEEMLSALNENNVDKAREIAIRYNFYGRTLGKKRRRKQKKYAYYCQNPEGEINRFEKAGEAAKFMGIATDTLYFRLTQDNGEWKTGEMKGWRVWRVEVAE